MRSEVIRVIRAFTAASLLAGTLMSGACTGRGTQEQLEPLGGAERQPFGEAKSPVEVNARTKAADFRLNPPPVEGIQLKRTGERGRSLLLARIGPDTRVKDTLTLRPDGEPVVLRDDGKEGDEKAGDRIFAARVPLDFDEEVKRQDTVLRRSRKRRNRWS